MLLARGLSSNVNLACGRFIVIITLAPVHFTSLPSPHSQAVDDGTLDFLCFISLGIPHLLTVNSDIARYG